MPLAVFVSDKHVPNKSEYKFSNFEDWLRGPRAASRVPGSLLSLHKPTQDVGGALGLLG